MTNKKIVLAVAENQCFLHVLGDNIRYYDITSLNRAHPELSSYIAINKYELEREMLKQNEVLSNRTI